MDLQPGEPVLEPLQLRAHGLFDPFGHIFGAHYAAVGIELDLHGSAPLGLLLSCDINGRTRCDIPQKEPCGTVFSTSGKRRVSRCEQGIGDGAKTARKLRRSNAPVAPNSQILPADYPDDMA